ncbi:hypothetical protein [Endozoicomonas numazuensis]|uniref:Uncharacterized protein n=1 Tax=Endozoicomonas numazuensis TaxID=1137799 RepID=A0A081NL68_9GAMM|nr:hypothetical protein [Endozoicomonas numazuensis]KEQ19191.1 hypothetical protein GZ78_04135 [Endozoicomonas numazuensis]
MVNKDHDFEVEALAQKALLESLLNCLVSENPTVLYKMLRDLDKQMRISPDTDTHLASGFGLKRAQGLVLQLLEKHDPQP